MSWLFGKKKEAKKQQPNPQEAIKNINEQIESIDAREKLLEKKMTTLTHEALQLNKAKNKRGAILALKKKKMFEGEFNKISGMKLMLEQQKVQIEASINDADIFTALKKGNEAINTVNKEVNIDNFQELKDDLEEQQANAEEIGTFFGDMAKEGEDELLQELDQLESDNVEQQLQGADVPVDSISSGVPQSNVPVAPKASAAENDSKLLEDLMA
eukprot:TRINITY_DN12983_c0_g7_i1.p2 TRINITY_DN12983_c0_g7~~TRINITY_DN12983_c0_g7_i1.p2  ORF type:complete len:214 (-),score=100.01 TRINITY_DN12983_c0_g7_i1:4-645(-)